MSGRRHSGSGLARRPNTRWAGGAGTPPADPVTSDMTEDGETMTEDGETMTETL